MEDTKLDIKVIVQNRFVQNISSEQPQSFLKDEVEEMNLPQGWTTSLVGEHRYIVSPEGDLKRDFKQQNLQFDCLFAPGEIFKDLVAALAQMVKLGTTEGEVCSKSLVGFFSKPTKLPQQLSQVDELRECLLHEGGWQRFFNICIPLAISTFFRTSSRPLTMMEDCLYDF